MFRFIPVFAAPILLTTVMHASVVALSPSATLSPRAALAQASSSPDSDLAAKVKSGLAADAELKSVSIAVTASKGTVTLEGEVPSVIARAKAGELAQRTDGVKKVNNKLKLAN